jgi:putative serine protease PepD
VVGHTIDLVDDPTPVNPPSTPEPDSSAELYPPYVAYARPWSAETGRIPQTRPNPPQPTPKQSNISTGVVAFISAVVGAIAVVGLLAKLGLFTSESTEAAAAAPIPTATTIVRQVTTEIVTSPLGRGVAEAVGSKVLPSVVTVEVGDLDDETLTLNGSGSGVILEDGYIVTNHHVVEGATVARVVLQDGRTYDTEIIGSDAYTDLAVLRVDVDGLTPIEFGDADDLAIGRLAVAVGNPLGQDGGSSLTVGVISALSRTVDFGDSPALFGMLQTDAPITSGSSGGALVDENGKLIGITAAIGVSQAGAEGIGYAIPVELVQRITSEIIETGGAKHSFIGIYGADYVITADDGALTPGGAEIADFVEGESAAADAGLLVGDAIVDVEGVDVRTMEDLVIQLRLFHVGDEVLITVNRDGSPVTAVVRLDERPDDPVPLVDEEPIEELPNGDE